MNETPDIRGFLILIVVCVLFYMFSPTVQASFREYPELSEQCKTEYVRVTSLFKFMVEGAGDEIWTDSEVERIWNDAVILANVSNHCKM